MERRRTFCKMRDHVGLMQFSLKFSVLVDFFFSSHGWIKLKPSFFPPFPFFLGKEKQELLPLTQPSFGKLPKPGHLPHGRTGANFHPGVSDISVQLQM